MSQAAFDFEVRREMRAKDGIRPLAKLLQSDDAKVVEQAMMAVANLALDVPTKQAIAVLGGMGFCAGLLSSSDIPVQANACLAVGRLVYDFNSASEFNDKDGASLLTEILSSYVATAEKWEAALAASEEKGDKSRPEGVDEPDANLGQCLMDSLCSVSEHGTPRCTPHPPLCERALSCRVFLQEPSGTNCACATASSPSSSRLLISAWAAAASPSALQPPSQTSRSTCSRAPSYLTWAQCPCS
jgi:hypothetical protein